MPPRIAGTHLRRKGTPAEWQAATELTYCGGNLKSSKYEITQLDFDRTSLLPDTELILTNLGDQYERNAWRHATDVAVIKTHDSAAYFNDYWNCRIADSLYPGEITIRLDDHPEYWDDACKWSREVVIQFISNVAIVGWEYFISFRIHEQT